MDQRTGVILVAAWWGCSRQGDDLERDTFECCDYPIPSPTMESMLPENGATNVFYQTPIEFEFSGDVSYIATITLSAGDSPVDGVVSFDESGEEARFTPSAPLRSSTTYTVTVVIRDAPAVTASWTTSATGATVDATALVGGVYALDLLSGRVLDPAGISDLLPVLLGDSPPTMLLSPSAWDGSALTLSAAPAQPDGASQDLCAESFGFAGPVDFSTNPAVAVEGSGVPIPVAGARFVVDALHLTGAFTPAGDAIEGITLSGTLDLRKATVPDYPDRCELVVIAGIACEPCSDGAMACVPIQTDSMVAPRVSTAGLTPIDAAAIAANPACVP